MENIPPNVAGKDFKTEHDKPEEDLIEMLKRKIEEDSVSLKPNWFNELGRVSTAIKKLSETKVRPSEINSSQEKKQIIYPSSVGEALGGLAGFTGKLNYSALLQERYIQFSGNNGKLPSDESHAVDQLKATQWTIHGDGKGGGVVRNIQKISDWLLNDLPKQLKETFVADPQIKKAVNAAIQKTGTTLIGWDCDSLTVQLQEVYWNSRQGKPSCNSVLSIRVSEKVNGEFAATILGMNPYLNADERKYTIPRDIATNFMNRFDRFFSKK